MFLSQTNDGSQQHWLRVCIGFQQVSPYVRWLQGDQLIPGVQRCWATVLILTEINISTAITVIKSLSTHMTERTQAEHRVQIKPG